MIVPVFCDNPDCREIWLTQSPLGSTKNATNNKYGPCPTCSGYGSLPDGEYTSGKLIVSNPAHWERFTSALSHLQDTINNGGTPAEVQDQINRFPELKAYLQGFKVKNLKDLQTALIIIGMLYAAFGILKSDQDDVQLPLNPVPVIEQFVNSFASSSSETADKED